MAFIDDYIMEKLTEKRRIHTYAVADTAVHLAKLYGADLKKARMAALYHDTFKWLKGEALDETVKALGLKDVYLGNPNLAHGKIAAAKLPELFGENDPDIINAVSYHTTGRAGMSKLEKIVYLADAIEPSRRYPNVEKIRKMAEKDLDKAVLMCMQYTYDYVTSHGKYLDKDTLEAIKYMKYSINKKGR